MAKLLAAQDPDPDIGPYGYSRRMYVYRCRSWTEERLVAAGATRAAAEVLLHGMSELILTDTAAGTGRWVDQDLRQEDAEAFKEGEWADLFFQKNRELGFGSLIAIRPVAPELGMEPNP